jgi:hypothetical protein
MSFWGFFYFLYGVPNVLKSKLRISALKLHSLPVVYIGTTGNYRSVTLKKIGIDMLKIFLVFNFSKSDSHKI